MKKFFFFAIVLLISCPSPGRDLVLSSVRGVKADGRTKVTVQLQKAVDEVSASGGGRVILSGGVFLTAPFQLKSGVELFIDADAVLLGSPDNDDYPDLADSRHVRTEDLPRWRNTALIYADETSHVSITGRGTIDCNGKNFVREKKDPDWTAWQYERNTGYEKSIPRAVFFAGCSDVTVRDITMVNQPAGWSYWVHDCDRVIFDGCKIFADVHYPNNDGIHINSSRDVTVSNCIIETGDDSIVLRANNRSLPENKACERVVVTNCVLRSWSSAIRIGWCNDGVIRNCTLSNLVIYDSSNGITCYLPDLTTYSNDYGREATLVENLSFSDIRMYEIYGVPIGLKVSDKPETLFAGFRNVRFTNIDCSSLEFPHFYGRAGVPVEVTFDGCTFVKCREADFPGDRRRHGYCVRINPADAESVPAAVTYNNTNFIIK